MGRHSSPGCITARMHPCSHFMGEQPGNRSSRVSQPLRIMVRSQEPFYVTVDPCIRTSPAKALGNIGCPREARFPGGRRRAKAPSMGLRVVQSEVSLFFCCAAGGRCEIQYK